MSGHPFQSRLKFLGFLFTLAALVVGLRLVWLQVVRYPDFRQMARRQQLTPREVRAERGQILDRNGVALAVNIDLYNVYAHPNQITDKSGTAASLARALGLSYPEVLRKLRGDAKFTWIARQVPYERSQAAEGLRLDGVGSYKEQRRFYPDHEMAAHVLGFTGLDNQGLEGLESRYEKALAGVDGYQVTERDARGRAVLTQLGASKSPHDGENVVTTLDTVIQHITQVELEKAFVRYRCQAGSAVVMDPKTGKILALANYPLYDPNHYRSFPPALWGDRTVNSAFEPGSTFKLVACTAALEEGAFNEDDKIFCENGHGVFEYGRVVTDHEKYGWLPFREVFGYSSNIGFVKIGMALGKDRLYKWIKRFGFGDPTGVDLPGEATGIVQPPDKWSGLSMTSIPYGYEIATTPIQLLCAYAAVANGGVMMKPMLVDHLEDAEGNVIKTYRPAQIRKVCSAKTAKRVTALLRWVVEKGTGTAVDLPGYDIAGKTGTAHKVIKKRYSPYNYLSSFVGFVPADNPRYVIYVSLDDPRGVYWGGYTAGPVFKEVAKRVLAYADVPQNGQQAVAEAPGQARVPSFAGLTENQCRQVADRAGIPLAFTGKGPRVTDQSMAAGGQVTTGKKAPSVQLTLGEPVEVGDAGGRMPDLRGKTKRQALALLSPLGLRVQFRGRGLIRGQSPLPGAGVGAGSSCDLACDTGNMMAGPVKGVAP